MHMRTSRKPIPTDGHTSVRVTTSLVEGLESIIWSDTVRKSGFSEFGNIRSPGVTVYDSDASAWFPRALAICNTYPISFLKTAL